MSEPKCMQARVKVLVGPRMMSDLMANAGLGITGVGFEQEWRLTFNEGEEVTEERVKAAMDKTIAGLDAENHPQKIVHYEVKEIVGIYET